MRALISILILVPVLARGAAFFTSASAQYGELTSLAGLTTYPMTLHCICTWNSIAAHTMLSAGSGTTERVQLDLDSSGFVSARSVNSGGSGFTANTSGMVTGVVYHVTGVFASPTNRLLYLNGAQAGTSANSISVANIDRVVVGSRRSSGSLANYHDGMLAHAAVWNIALSATEVAALGNSNAPVSPLRIRPENIVFYAPLVHVPAGSAYNAVGPAIPWGNAPTAAIHPKVNLP